MREEIIKRYVADDGKVFDDETECEIYECSLIKNDVMFLSCDNNSNIISKISVSTVSDIENADIIVVETIKGAAWVDEACKMYGISSPFDADEREVNLKLGIFVYDYDKYCWYEWESFFKAVCAKNEQLKKFLEGEETSNE